MRGKKFVIVFMLLFLLGLCAGCGKEASDMDNERQPSKTEANSEQEKQAGAELASDDIVVLFTTDVHHKLTDYIGYDGLAAYKKEIEAICGEERVVLVDCGDCLDSGELGDNTSGAAIAAIMDEVGYDVAVPGNHDFKYGVENLKQIAAESDFQYLCCNLREKSSGSPVLESCAIVEKGGKKLAFIGVTTPKGTFTYEGSDEFGVEIEEGVFVENPRYDFWEDAFYERVQQVVDEVRAQGADYVILVSHLGYNTSVCSSTELINNTTGIDAVLDGHAHVEIEMEQIENANGEKVIQAADGCFLMNIGELTISKEGEMTTRLIPMADYLEKDANVTEFIESLKNAETGM